MTRDEDCERALRRGIDFLRKSQLPSGEFVTLMAKDRDFSNEVRADSSVFATAHIVSSVLGAGVQNEGAMVRRAADFLWNHRLPGSVWKFWTKTHAASPNSPPDMDDTCVVSMALRDAGRTFPQSKSLLLCNQDELGRFYTWILPRSRLMRTPRAWLGFLRLRQSKPSVARFFETGQARRDDVDAVVNANAVTWFSRNEPQTKRACDWIVQVIAGGAELREDRYYQSREALYYAVVRGMRSGVTGFKRASGFIANRIAADIATDGSVGASVHKTALASIALAELQGRTKELLRAIGFLLATQRADGSWPAEPFYFGGWNWRYCWGSSELTTGFCVEALGCHLKTTA